MFPVPVLPNPKLPLPLLPKPKLLLPRFPMPKLKLPLFPSPNDGAPPPPEYSRPRTRPSPKLGAGGRAGAAIS